MNARTRRLLLPILLAVKEGRPSTHRLRSAARQALFLVEKPASEKKRSANQQKKAGRAAARQARNLTTAKIRDFCMKRSGSHCEARPWRGGGHGWPDVMDHWLGGSGRRVQQQSVETCWMLCVFCNGERTDNYPDAAFWNEIRRQHCLRYGYKFTPHIIHNPVSAAAGGGEV